MPADRATVYACDLVTNARRARPIVPFHDVSWTETLNGQGTFDGAVPQYFAGTTDGTLEPGATSLYVDVGGVLRAGAIVWEHDIDQDGTADWRVLGENHMSYWLDGPSGSRRTIIDRQGMLYAISTGAVNGQAGAAEVTFPNALQGTPVDQFNLVADLLRHGASIATGGNVGFDSVRFYGPGSASPEGEGNRSGVTWARTYWGTDLKGIGQAIVEISQSYPGFDWAVNYAWDTTTAPYTPKKYLDLYYPRRGVARSGVVLRHGGNVSLVKINRSARALAQRVVGIGSSSGSASLKSIQQDPSVVAPSGSYPYLEGYYGAYSEAIQGNLDARTRSRLAVTRLPVNIITVRVNSDPTYGIRLGDVSVGDTCYFSTLIPVSGFSISDWYRVTQQTVRFNDAGLDSWDLILVQDSPSTGVF